MKVVEQGSEDKAANQSVSQRLNRSLLVLTHESCQLPLWLTFDG